MPSAAEGPISIIPEAVHIIVIELHLLTYSTKRWLRTRRNQIVIISLVLTTLVYFVRKKDIIGEMEIEATRRHIEKRLADGLRLDKGTGCEVQQMNPFSKEIMQFQKDVLLVRCTGMDWVKCWRSKCRVVPEILRTTRDITCRYRDIIYESDDKRHLGPLKEVKNADSYTLVNSDHAKVVCLGKPKRGTIKQKKYTKWSRLKWTGHVAGFRNSVAPKTPPKGREKTLNVLIFGFDSTSRNGFIRKMPKSYKYLTEKLHGTILKRYNIVGDGTSAALFPILTGKTEFELPDIRKVVANPGTLEELPLIFYKLNEDGYRTAFFEDSPWIGTFPYHFVGFRKQPTDHYLQPLFLEEYQTRSNMWMPGGEGRYCMGSTPRYKLMMNLTHQFLQMGGKRFIFTFIGDICHDNFNVNAADSETVQFLKALRKTGTFKDTMLVMMGDHGSRFGDVRGSLQGKFEERLPLMAIVLPRDLKVKRPDAQKNLEFNADVLTTPHDIYATLLDALDWRQYWNKYKVPGADLPRALSLLKPVPKSRSCSEAGIEPHWCSCLQWQNVSETNPMYRRVAETLVNYIDKLTERYSKKNIFENRTGHYKPYTQNKENKSHECCKALSQALCAPRTLTSISWVMRQLPIKPLFPVVVSPLLSFGEVRGKEDVNRNVYEVKIEVGPGVAIYESSLIYNKNEDKVELNFKDIFRINDYNDESHCISAYPHLYTYCYCYKLLPTKGRSL